VRDEYAKVWYSPATNKKKLSVLFSVLTSNEQGKTLCCSVYSPATNKKKQGLARRVGQNHTYIYDVYTVFLAGKSPNIRSHAVRIYVLDLLTRSARLKSPNLVDFPFHYNTNLLKGKQRQRNCNAVQPAAVGNGPTPRN